MRGNVYQSVMIGLGLLITLMYGVFLLRELHPEYKIYQDDYVELEKFRSTYTGQSPPPFKFGVKQIVMEVPNKGPAEIDRCTSCHVALQFEHFSPTKIKTDTKGNIVKDSQGVPEKEPNSNYIWSKLDEKVDDLQKQGKKGEADTLAALKVAQVGEHTYDVTKVLQMHPLMGKETRPFEYHPIDEYGCTLCHGGNGRGLATEKAHGPVFDGEYEAHFEGPKPKFLELDPKNDPKFARIFNNKPGHQLLFQITPLLVGHLMEAKCVQCHERPGEVRSSSANGDIDRLTKDFHAGEQLFISQACYACHRIAGFARGGVGPELSNSGKNYPWFLKESIVWPQADLPTSTMPNYRLDHVELEDLMTFLLAQNGRTKSIGETDYKVELAEWEAGAKLPWEKPSTPAQMHDVRYGMTIFATQGCSACHRLKGFESDVGFAVEKTQGGKPVDFKTLYAEKQWFARVFPEEIQGSEIVDKVDKYTKEIDQKIVDHVRKGSIVEEIYQKDPQAIEGLYSNFRYASRAKNDHYEQLAKNEKDPDKKKVILTELQNWKERIHRILMVYIQEYGLGRLIGPRPNWSGIYRSDEWLIEHFWNPQAHVARSIMPVFPFDDTKFYALTYMLDILGKKNRDEVRTIWNNLGFNPEQAYMIHCSQCHGSHLQGNGAVAEWIYPIPKNLRNGDFLRNLTKHQAINSIVHGVQGGPMPPWSETHEHKPEYDGIPVLTKEEITALVEWLFSSLPGGEVFKTEEEVPKWQYDPSDAIQELKDEGNLKDFLHGCGEPPLRCYLASLEPATSAEVDDITEIFDVIPNPNPVGEKKLYYIKQKFYTEKNLHAGQTYFNVNCATCHGKDADGSGMRAGTMYDAKPRMLTNLDWLDTRDDLRLLRSIKYGVVGTAMTPWGDQTSSMQRMQLVMYIRSLSTQAKLREQLLTALYQSFKSGEIAIEKARVAAYPKIAELTENYQKAHQLRNSLDVKVQEGELDSAKAVEAYKNELLLFTELKKAKAVDIDLNKILAEIASERKIYEHLGMSLINKNTNDHFFKIFDQVITLNKGRYSFNDNKLLMTIEPDHAKKMTNMEKQLIQSLNLKIKELEEQEQQVLGKIGSPQRNEEVATVASELHSYTKIRNDIETGFENILKSVLQQQKLYKEYLKTIEIGS